MGRLRPQPHGRCVVTRRATDGPCYRPDGAVVDPETGCTAHEESMGHGDPDCPCDMCEYESRLPLCPACVAGIGGAHAGPDAEWRECAPGESCGAADCAGKGES